MQSKGDKMQYDRSLPYRQPPKKRRRVRGRFFVFLAILFGLIGLGIWGIVSLVSGPKLYELSYGRLEKDSRADALLVRVETAEPLASYSRVQYHATENQDVRVGDEIMTVFSLGYSSSYVEELENIRGKIAGIQEQRFLSGVIDSDVERFNQMIAEQTRQITAFARGARSGVRFVNLERDLTTLLSQRQAFIKGKQNETGDAELNALYNDEKEYEMKIQNWLTTYTAAVDGRVSYLFDGYEYHLRPETMASLTTENVAEMLKSSVAPPIPAEEKDMALPNIYRIVTPDEWYALLLVKEKSWSFADGTECEIAFAGFEEMQFVATVQSVKGDGDMALVVLRINEDMGSLINARKVSAILGGRVEGIMLPRSAIMENGARKGVYLEDGQTFVDVELKGMDDHGYALVAPREELKPGVKIRMRQP